MTLGIKALTTIVVVLIVLLVGGSCLGVTLITTLNVFNSLSRNWAQNIASNIAATVENHFTQFEQNAISTVLTMNYLGYNDAPSKLRDRAVDPKNWTDALVPLLIKVGTETNFSIGSAGYQFGDWHWAILAQNSFRSPSQPETWVIEWGELFDNSTKDVTVGGFQFYVDDRTPLPYGNETNFQPVSFKADVPIYRREEPSVLQIFTVLKQRKPWNPVPLIWSGIYHHWLPRRNIHWEVYVLAGILDDAGQAVGSIAVGLTVERDLMRLLRQAPRSTNTHVFLISPLGDIIATTKDDTSFWTSIEVNHTTPASKFGTGCSRSDELTPGLQPPRLGCRLDISEFPYPPLNAVTRSTAITKTQAFEFDVADGKRYAVSSERMTTSVGRFEMNVVAIVLEDDVGVGEFAMAMGLAAGLCCIVSIIMVLIALCTLHYVTKRLQLVQLKLLALASLQNLNGGDENEQRILGDDDAVARREEEQAAHALEKGALNQKLNIDLKENSVNDGEEEETSWISEIANLEEAYKETARSMTNFTRYVSRAVVSELIISRSIMNQRAQRTNQQMAKRSSNMMNTTVGSNNSPSSHHLMQQENLLSLQGADEGGSTLRSYDDLTVLFVEIEGFSKIWRMTAPEYHAGVCMVLHIYFKRMCRLIMGHGGIVDRFLGDSIMSYWGAPVQTEYHAHFAVLCALALLRETTRDPLKKIFMNAFNKQLKLRGGLASGTALVGTIETRENLNYTILGTPVTHAKHLQSFNKAWKTSMLMDQNTAMKVGDMVHSRLLCNASFQGNVGLPFSKQQEEILKGEEQKEQVPVGKSSNKRRAKPIKVYELIGIDTDSRLVRDRVLAPKKKKKIKKKKNTGNSTKKDAADASWSLLSNDASSSDQRQQQQGHVLEIPNSMDDSTDDSPSNSSRTHNNNNNNINNTPLPGQTDDGYLDAANVSLGAASSSSMSNPTLDSSISATASSGNLSSLRGLNNNNNNHLSPKSGLAQNVQGKKNYNDSSDDFFAAHDDDDDDEYEYEDDEDDEENNNDVGTAPLSDLLSEATLRSQGMRELLGPFGQQVPVINDNNRNNKTQTFNQSNSLVNTTNTNNKNNSSNNNNLFSSLSSSPTNSPLSQQQQSNNNNSSPLTDTDLHIHYQLRESAAKALSSQCLTRLLKWHFTRTNVESRPLIEFCHRFREAALLVVDQKFKEAKSLLQQILTTPSFSDVVKINRQSIQQLVQFSTMYSKKAPPRTNVDESGEFFIVVKYDDDM